MAPLFEQFAISYRSLASAEGVTPDIGQMVGQLSDSIRQMGEGSNLLNGLISGTLLHVPSLPVVTANWLPHYTIDITTMGEAANLVAGLQFAGPVARGHLPDAAGVPVADRQCGGLIGWAGGRGRAAALAAGHWVCLRSCRWRCWFYTCPSASLWA